MLRFLKEGRVAGVSQAAEVLGYRVRTVQRWWQCYREGGLAERITPEAWEGLQAEMRAGHMAGGADLSARHLAHRDAIDALSKLAQDQAERPHHRNSPAEQAAFKK
jgi:hypothetical protein